MGRRQLHALVAMADTVVVEATQAYLTHAILSPRPTQRYLVLSMSGTLRTLSALIKWKVLLTGISKVPELQYDNLKPLTRLFTHPERERKSVPCTCIAPGAA